MPIVVFAGLPLKALKAKLAEGAQEISIGYGLTWVDCALIRRQIAFYYSDGHVETKVIVDKQIEDGRKINGGTFGKRNFRDEEEFINYQLRYKIETSGRRKLSDVVVEYERRP